MTQGRVLFVGTSFVCTKFQYLPVHWKMGVVNGSDLFTSVSIMTSTFCGAKISLDNTATTLFLSCVYAISEICCVLFLACKRFCARYGFDKYLDIVAYCIQLL
jgi:hypothetical protein